MGGAGAGAGAGGSGGSGGGEVPGCPGGHIPFVDGFDDGVVGSAWLTFINAPATLAEANGAAEVNLPATNENEMYGGLRSVDEFDVAGCAVFVAVDQATDSATQGFTQFYLTAGDQVAQVEISKISGQLQFKQVVQGQQEELLQVPYDAVAHRYWRLREAGGAIYWETSANAVGWQVHVSRPSVLPSTLARVGVGAGTYQVEPSTPGLVRFGAVNLP
ncbi:Hypothetical protein CAP_0318 [Chondromyces apiculatus DSM 436]|uniref:Uncharacterized protein n=1 Tax=Chondromyces apiculatus DSM 436 TaxID=1192034 RepID=A0A017SWJ8_9BACT|nr:Hypothetical protein CAP_0318 [Chondromyces apiculatus DSM 436]